MTTETLCIMPYPDRTVASFDRVIIIVELRNVFGNVLCYPVCPVAERFARLTGRKTFNQSDIREMRALGFEPMVEWSTRTMPSMADFMAGSAA